MTLQGESNKICQLLGSLRGGIRSFYLFEDMGTFSQRDGLRCSISFETSMPKWMNCSFCSAAKC